MRRSGLDYVFRRVEIRLPDFQMDDLAPFGFEGAGPYQNFKSSLGTEPLHAVSEPQGKTGSVCVGVKIGSRGCHGAHILFAAERGVVQRGKGSGPDARPRLPEIVSSQRTGHEQLGRAGSDALRGIFAIGVLNTRVCICSARLAS